MDFHYTPLLQRLFTASRELAAAHHNEFLTPEHLLLACVQADLFKGIVPLDRLEALRAALVEILDRDLTTSSEPPEPSFLWQRLEHFAALQALGSQVQTLDITHSPPSTPWSIASPRNWPNAISATRASYSRRSSTG